MKNKVLALVVLMMLASACGQADFAQERASLAKTSGVSELPSDHDGGLGGGNVAEEGKGPKAEGGAEMATQPPATPRVPAQPNRCMGTPELPVVDCQASFNEATRVLSFHVTFKNNTDDFFDGAMRFHYLTVVGLSEFGHEIAIPTALDPQSSLAVNLNPIERKTFTVSTPPLTLGVKPKNLQECIVEASGTGEHYPRFSLPRFQRESITKCYEQPAVTYE